jgi:pimeloyl-ACP methyl ester carboxylesterase
LAGEATGCIFWRSLDRPCPGAATTYNFANDKRAPLLFIAGGNDHILPPAVQRENFEKNAKRSRAITAYKEFAGRSHYTCGDQGWESVADFELDWALAPTAGNLGNA